MTRKFLAAAGQMNSQDDKELNIKTAGEMIDEAASRGAKIISFPENMNYIGRGSKHYKEAIPGHTTDYLCEKARQNEMYVVTGSIIEDNGDLPPRNTLILINPKGDIVCKYSKLHMFDVDIVNGSSYKESDYVTPGDEIVMADTELGKIGFAICYDLRFDEMFRLMALNGADMFVIPSSFTLNTGRDHYEQLLKARAIENSVYIIAPEQYGKKTNMTAFGRSQILGPWGDVLAKAEDRTQIIYSEIDYDYRDSVLAQVPALKNRRPDMYEISSSSLKIYKG
ncbi:MAG: carbon-nitrogen hydrolase family protein [Lachnospiraceae bacterium]|nr:carbon-nitrogen hydrolase family protein [Lachnospiraceae bacterium]